MKRKMLYCVLCVLVLASLSGCGKNKTPSNDRVNLKEYHQQYQQDTLEVKKSSYEKLDFSGCTFADLPDSDTVCVLDVENRGIGVEEGISLAKNWLKDTGNTKIDLRKELRDASGQIQRNDTEEYPYNYPSVMENRKKLKSGDGFFINTKECYLQMGADGFYSVSDGSITKYLKQDGHAAADALGSNEENIVDEGSYEEMADKSYELLSGKISVAEAADITRKFFMQGTPFEPEKNVSCDIPYVSVFSMGAKYGYAFTMRRTYQNIPFAYSSSSSIVPKSRYYVVEDDKTAYVVNKNTVAAYTGDNEGQPLSVQREEKEILGLRDAVSLLNDKLARELQMAVDHVELVYCRVALDEKNEKYVVYPCWEFDGKVQNNNNRLRVYLDVLTGELHLYAYPEKGTQESDGSVE